MRKSIAIIITSILVLSGCNKQQSVSDRLLNEVEKAIAINPDSASNLLKSISSPEKLDDKAFARWCMLSGKITDEIFNSILPTYQLERAYDWYSSHGSPDEQVQILIYLGRSYFADGDYDKAMSIYTNALDIAGKNKLNNLIGYTYDYIGDLYREKFMFTEAIKKYEMAADNFKKENNIEYYPSLYQVSLLDQSNHFFEYIMKYGNFVSGASTYYKKEIFDKYGLFDEKYKLLEDYPFYVNLAFNNEKIGYIDYPTIQYELGGISTASNRNPLLDQDYVTLFKDVLSQKDIHLSHMTKRALNYRIDKITKKYNSFLVQLLYIDVVIMLCLNKAGIIKG